MLRSTLALSLSTLLVACGGGGTPSVEDTPDPAGTPSVNAPEPDSVSTPEPQQMLPEPVNFDFDTSDLDKIEFTEDAFILDGVTYQLTEDLVTRNRASRNEHGNRVAYHEAERSTGPQFVAILVSDGAAHAAVGVLTSDLNILVPSIEGISVAVPELTMVTEGSATFQGEYASYYLQQAVELPDGGFSREVVGSYIIGDMSLDVEFGEFLSESAFSGVVENRQQHNLRGGEWAELMGLDDIQIENGRIDDTGQILADVSGGNRHRLDYDDVQNEAFGTSPGLLNGQLGGEGAGVAAGTLTLTHHQYREPRGFDLHSTEIGTFVLRQD